MSVCGIGLSPMRHRPADDIESLFKRSYNIGAFSNLDKIGLSYHTNQRRMLLHITDAGERIFIQYPGKESVRTDRNIRPWDFRPKLDFPDGSRHFDISFMNVRDDLRSIGRVSGPRPLRMLATLFCRMAYMTDHDLALDSYRSGEVELPSEKYTESGITGLCYYRFNPNKSIIEGLQEKIGDIGGVSVEAYLYLNEYIAQNEDCKYHFRDITNNYGWNIERGRYNMLMTYVNIIGMMMKVDGCSDCDLKHDVNPIPEHLIPKVTGNLITH